MDWASNLFIALLLTDITGTIFFLMAEILKKLAVKDVRDVRFLMKTTLCAYIIPFVYLVFYLSKRYGRAGVGSDINLFYNTPLTLRLNALLGCIWMGLFLVQLGYRLYRRYQWAMICRGNIPEEDEKIFNVFTDICAGLEIGGEITLCRNDSVKTPCITYHHGFTVILPLVHYTEEEAEIIFYHELCHYLNRDLFLKTFGSIAALLHVFNPAAHILLGQMDIVCEKYCDRVACKKGEHIFNSERYFQVIFDLMLSESKREKYLLFAIADDTSNYERRVRHMLDYHQHGGLKKGTAVLLSACFLLGSSTTSFAAGNGVAAAYEAVTKESSVMEVESLGVISDAEAEAEVREELVKAYGVDPEDVVFMGADGIQPLIDNEMFQVKWSIPADKVYVTSGFTMDVGDIADVTIVGDPDHVEFRYGIKDPKQIMRYVEGSAYSDHKFEIEIKGRHYFFVYNLSAEEELVIHANVTLVDKESLKSE